MKFHAKTTLCSLLCLGLVLCMLFLSAGCAVEIQAKELSANYTRQTLENGQVTDEFIVAMSNFSMSLAQKTWEADKALGEHNHLVSPLSAVICLAMIANGAKGETLTQMESVLGMDKDALNQALYAYTSTLYTAKDCQISIADSIWYRDDTGRLTVKEEFLQTCANWYDAQQYAAPFDKTTKDDINAWVKEHTDGMIEKIIEDGISPDAVMYIINTLVFDAKWLEEYEKNDIRDDTFRNADGTTTTLPMMSSTEHIYFQTEGGTGFAKKYKGGYSFVGLLPDEGVDVYDFAASLDGQAWQTMWSQKTFETVHVRIPEFSYDRHMEMTDILADMGMTHLFNPNLCDLSGIGTSSAGNLSCSRVAQKTFIEVSRHGTKAAAATWGEMTDGAAEVIDPKIVSLDRPFVYAIVDNATGLPLFVGIVTQL